MEHVLENHFDGVLVIIRYEYLSDKDGDENVEQVVEVHIVLEIYPMVKLDENSALDSMREQVGKLRIEQNLDRND